MDEKMAMVCFELISAVGSARSCYVEAIHQAQEGCFDEALESVKKGRELFSQGHHIHADLLQKDASGEGMAFSLLLLHSEDQLMSAETFGIMAEEFIAVYRKIAKEKE